MGQRNGPYLRGEYSTIIPLFWLQNSFRFLELFGKDFEEVIVFLPKKKKSFSEIWKETKQNQTKFGALHSYINSLNLSTSILTLLCEWTMIHYILCSKCNNTSLFLVLLSSKSSSQGQIYISCSLTYQLWFLLKKAFFMHQSKQMAYLHYFELCKGSLGFFMVGFFIVCYSVPYCFWDFLRVP